MENSKPLFTPQLLLSAPRRSPGVPNPSGTTVLFTTTSYSFQKHSQNTTLQALLVQTGEIVNLAINQSISYINWLSDECFVCLRSEKDGRTSLLYATFSANINNSGGTTSFHTAGIINASVSSMKIAQLGHDCNDFAVVISAPARQDGTLYTPADAAQKTNATGRLYSGLFVRHWDRYEGPDKNSLWYGKLSSVRGSQYELSHLTNLLAGTSMECPIRPFGGSDHFDVRKDAVIWVAKDPELNPSWNTRCKIFIRNVDSWAPEGIPTDSCVRQIDVPGFDGAAVSPVFATNGDKAAFLMMRKNRYEADKNQIFVVKDIKAPQLEIVRAFCHSEQYLLEGGWDRSPSNVCFAADGESLIVIAEDQGYGRVFLIESEEITSPGMPRPLTPHGAAVEVRCLPDGRLFISGTSMVDDSWYLMTHSLAEVMRTPTDILPKAAWSHSNSDQGNRLGLQRSQIGCIWSPASNPEIAAKVHSWIFKPSTFDKKKRYPVAYLIHGGPHAAWKDSWSTRWNPAVFAEQGYIVVAPNISGSTGFGQAFTDSSVGNWGGSPYHDLENVFEWVGQNVEGADNERAVTLGHSFGGFMINWIQGQELGRKFKALVCHGGIFSSVGMFSTDELHFHYYEMDGAPWLPAFESAVRPRHAVSSDRRRWDPSVNLSRWSTPELVIHSEKDYRVTIAESLALFNVLQARGIPSQFLVFPDENHWVLNPENSLAWHKTVLNWINQYVGLPQFTDQDPDDVEYWGGRAD